jgi:phosphosulfolactate synthase (CoM biosynthesis protein A)
LSISLDEKCKLIEMATLQYGLKVLAESGAETEKTDPTLLLEDIEACLQAGAWKVLVEANELVSGDGSLNMEIIDSIISRVDLASLMFEIPWVWLENVHWYQSFKALYTLTEQFEAPVNIGNVDHTILVWLELLRNGSSRRVG